MADIFLKTDAIKLLTGKKIVFLGDSNIRCLYKDLVWLLKNNTLISIEKLRRKGEKSHAGDRLIGRCVIKTGRNYKENRSYNFRGLDVKFHFITRCLNEQIIKFLNDIKEKRLEAPDVVVMNSTLWDLTRWGSQGGKQFQNDMIILMELLNESLPRHTMFIWVTAFPPGENMKNRGLIIKQIEFLKFVLRFEVMEANWYAKNIVMKYGYDVLDFHYHLRMQIHRRCRDGVHYKSLPMRLLTNILLTHIALSWGRDLPQNMKNSMLIRYQEMPYKATLNNEMINESVKRANSLYQNINCDDSGKMIQDESVKRADSLYQNINCDDSGNNEFKIMIKKDDIDHQKILYNTKVHEESHSEGGINSNEFYQKFMYNGNGNIASYDDNGNFDENNRDRNYTYCSNPTRTEGECNFDYIILPNKDAHDNSQEMAFDGDSYFHYKTVYDKGELCPMVNNEKNYSIPVCNTNVNDEIRNVIYKNECDLEYDERHMNTDAVPLNISASARKKKNEKNRKQKSNRCRKHVLRNTQNINYHKAKRTRCLDDSRSNLLNDMAKYHFYQEQKFKRLKLDRFQQKKELKVCVNDLCGRNVFSADDSRITCCNNNTYYSNTNNDNYNRPINWNDLNQNCQREVTESEKFDYYYDNHLKYQPSGFQNRTYESDPQYTRIVSFKDDAPIQFFNFEPERFVTCRRY